MTNGLDLNTVLLKDIFPGPSASYPASLKSTGPVAVLSANDGISGVELWRSDGTDMGTRLLQDIRPGVGSSKPLNFTIAGSRMFFTADDAVHGRELWVMPLTF